MTVEKALEILIEYADLMRSMGSKYQDIPQALDIVTTSLECYIEEEKR